MTFLKRTELPIFRRQEKLHNNGIVEVQIWFISNDHFLLERPRYVFPTGILQRMGFVENVSYKILLAFLLAYNGFCLKSVRPPTQNSEMYTFPWFCQIAVFWTFFRVCEDWLKTLKTFGTVFLQTRVFIRIINLPLSVEMLYSNVNRNESFMNPWKPFWR